MPERKAGTVIRVLRDKGYGFITCPADRRDYFFHQSALTGCGLVDLSDGTDGNTIPSEVTFVLGKSPKSDRLQAEDVRVAR